MKIPKKDGTTKPDNDSTDNWEDILCDKCGKSCRDDCDMNFEYAEISSTWGYGSNKDGQRHRGEICEPCYDTLGIHPTITDYLFGISSPCTCSKGSAPKSGPCQIHPKNDSSEVEGEKNAH